MSLIGQPLDRTDGILKVTGAAPYSAEHPQARLLYAVLVMSTIAKGRMSAIDTAEADAMPGVALTLTHLNAMRLPRGGLAAYNPPAGRKLTLLQDDAVRYQNQPVAVVVADTLERATAAAAQVRITYAQQAPILDFDNAKASGHSPGKVQGKPADALRGDMERGVAASAAHLDAVYTTPFEHHNPMEPHATTAVWDGDQLTVFDSTQYVTGARNTLAKIFGIAPERIRVICPFVGGGFGCKGSLWSPAALAVMAARHTGRPVKLVLERPQMFGPVGHRPHTEQHLMLAARADGQLTAVRHAVHSSTSELEDWTESSAMLTRVLYATPNLDTSHRLVPLSIGTPTFTRAPGEASGSFALEAALDELSYTLAMDPIALRRKNYAEADPDSGLPFSSKSLRECYRIGADKFGWARRSPAPRSMRAGNQLVGWGVASATYPANRSPASALARIRPDGTAVVASGTQDLGTGTFTVMTQVAADALGFPIDRVSFVLGDSSLPQAPVSGGSQSVASVSPAVRAAAQAVRAQLIELALGDPASPLHGATHGLTAADIVVQDGWLLRAPPPASPSAAGLASAGTPPAAPAPSIGEEAATLLRRNGNRSLEARVDVKPGDERKTHSFHSFGAVFVEVHVDPDLGIVSVQRVVAAYGVGKLLNTKLAHSQLMGGIVWGIGQALLEESQLDLRYGRFVNSNLAEYHVPVNADVRSIDVTVVDEDDPFINPLGTKGIGEIGITGVAGAIANAVYHATGVRVRDLPITLDKLLV
jgi:xanthine dehydrogenase YagR molybdenum-binding subunit